MSRWGIYPNSEKEELIQGDDFTTTTGLTTTMDIRKNMGNLLHATYSGENDRWLCQYKNLISDSPISYLCELGCCTSGCCAVGENYDSTTAFGWAIGLLVVIILVVIFAMIAMLTLYLLNKYNDKKIKKPIGSVSHSSTSSQISAPSTSSYYGHETIYPSFPPQYKTQY
uniref:CX domain-containing protein n=1 Tax=Rhabditophanes sp. KR3021 TaxID=114890 RepID=A0AC35U5G1_9BILA